MKNWAIKIELKLGKLNYDESLTTAISKYQLLLGTDVKNSIENDEFNSAMNLIESILQLTSRNGLYAT